MTDPLSGADWRARLEALDPSRSFIVQAPAGSGKTELLIQRYLVLLSHVGSPEEIAAITFTRKAAAEMRRRVLESLAAARGEERPAEPHRALTWEHARAVIERDRALGWRLEENSARLRIQTIDALCASLTRQMPVLAAFGAQPRSIEDAGPRYREAARATLALLEDEGKAAGDVAKLLAHLDNNLGVAEDLLAGMLRKRDHWLRNLHSADDRKALESALGAVRREAMARVRALAPAGETGELLALAAYAARNLAADDRESTLRDCADLGGLPGTGDADLFAWLGLAELLLTASGDWRKAADARIGFPVGADKAGRAAAKEWKGRHSALVAGLADSEDLRGALEALRRLPPARYTDAQWDALGAIADLLPLAVAELKLVFASRGEADFVEIAQGALAALGEPDAPTDLLLSLDYRIHHILVDEFQDTSFTQFELLEMLTAGWQGGGGDGRTLFLVGDPMQSIYRFREAEVGLFLRARQRGIGQVALTPLTLSANFRSQADIVDWVNRAFEQVMPPAENIAAGAVPYSPSEPVHPAQSGAVLVHAFFNGDAQGEAAQVAALVESAQAEDPEGSIAVLVRNRSHLVEIVPRLKERGLRFRAIEIEPLGHRQVVQDLLALTRALAHPADRLAWLALLRAPWCGLSLADLFALVAASPSDDGRPGAGVAKNHQDLFADIGSPSGTAKNPLVGIDKRTVAEMLGDERRLARLGADGRARIERVRPVLAHAMAERLRGSLRERVEAAWLALGGPACVEDDTDLEDAEIYLDYLEDSEEAGEIADLAALEEGVAKLYALPDLHAGEGLQIMTIHKAKGLEFDTVILPGLGGLSGKDRRDLFIWMERVAAGEGDSQLLLAPINPTGSDKDPIYEYIRDFDREKTGHENGRLLYVAATRARKHLHLVGDTRLQADDEGPAPEVPGAGSLLAKLWPAVESDFAEAARQAPLSISPVSGQGSARGAGAGPVDQDLRRLPSNWALPEAPCAAAWTAPRDLERAREQIEFSWAGETARRVGSVVHRWLQRIAEDGMQGWNRARVEAMRDAFRGELAAQGVEDGELAAAAGRVARALANSLDDARGRWLLGPQGDARSEYRLSSVVDGERRHLVIDRMFADAQGRRWIVDYKAGSHEGAEVDAFLDRERLRHRAQLERYARALGEGKTASLGLYFPAVPGWREWRYPGEEEAGTS